MRRLWMLSLVVGTLLVVGSSAAAAQDATPVAASDRAEYVVPASACVINALLPGNLNALATPEAEAAATPAAASSDVPFAVPTGEAADAETATAVAAVFRQAWACQNAGNLSRYFSLLTPSEIREHYTPEAVADAMSVPALELPAEEQTALYAILQVTIHDDGRAGAYVIVDTVANPEPVEVVYMIASQTDSGAWKVDDVITFAADGSAA